MVADQLTVGLTDKDIQGEVLAKHSQLKTFEEKFDLIQALEDGKHAKEQLSNESSLSTQRSSYHKQKSQTVKKQKPCPGCGSNMHGPSTDKPRKTHCPAYMP